ncbi:MAG: hypothetical protein M3R38_01570 [Actinomycetota bacterium]|nr:hypothetical protein [Actinomycetota bacterium]
MLNRRSSGQGSASAGTSVARVLAIVGLVVFVPAGLYLVSVALEAVGIVLGAAGYLLGARGIGAITVVVGIAAMPFSLLTQGYPVGPGT